MKSRFLLLAFSTVIATSVGGSAEAATAQGNLTVSATVVASCAVVTDPVNFGAYDGSTDVYAAGGLNVTCTAGTNATMRLDQGQSPRAGSTDAAPLRAMNLGGISGLNYNLYRDPAATVVWGNTAGTGIAVVGTGVAVNQLVYAKLGQGQVVPPGAYVDTVIASVDF